MIILTFDNPRDTTTPGVDGTTFSFPFAVRVVGEETLRDQIFHGVGSVSISGTLSSIWGFGRTERSDSNLTKTLFEFARKHIVEELKKGIIPDKFEISLTTRTAPKVNPFKPANIPWPAGTSYELQIHQIRPSKETPHQVGNEKPPKAIMVEQSMPDAQIQESLEKFRTDHPDPNHVAFIMMKFGNTRAHEAIVKVIRSHLQNFGITGLRADDKYYHDDLLQNVLTYIHGSSFGIAVFERLESDDFNENVSLELGYMMALRKPVCLLRDKTIPALQTDLIGRLYISFDTQDPTGTIPQVLEKWLAGKRIITHTSDEPRSAPHSYSVRYHGSAHEIRPFDLEVHEFGARNRISYVYVDGTADIAFHYEGVYPKDLFDQVARKHGLKQGPSPITRRPDNSD